MDFRDWEQEAAERLARRRRRRRKSRIRQTIIELAILLVLAVLLISIIAVPIVLVVKWLTPGEKPVSTPPPEPPAIVETEPIAYPHADKDTVKLGAEVNAPYAVLVDVTDNRIVAQKGADTVTYPASITKMMTLLVAVEQIEDMDATFEMSYEITDPLFRQGASMAGFRAGEKVSMTDLLYGCILPSGADATAALAIHVAGSEEAFAQMMNDKAKELGLKNTRFTNASGLHANDHYTTATDMAVILMAAMENETCRKVLTTVQYTSAKTEKCPDGLTWESTLFSRMYGTEPEGATVIGGKTGYTTEAGHTMASYAEGEDGHDYVFVTMGGTGKWKATYDCIDVLTAFFGPEETETTEQQKRLIRRMGRFL